MASETPLKIASTGKKKTNNDSTIHYNFLLVFRYLYAEEGYWKVLAVCSREQQYELVRSNFS